MKRHVLYARAPEWRALIERADDLIASPQFRASKSEGRTVAGVIDRETGVPVFIKRTAVASWSRGVAERLRGSRAAKAVRGARLLEAAGAPHPRPLAAMEIRERGAVRASYLLTEALREADTLSRFALGPGGVKGRDVRRRKRISDAIARAVRRLHDAGLYTRDLQETNLMVADDTAEGFCVYFIDLEDIRRARGEVSQRRRMINLVHLDRSIGRFLCRAARLAFLYAYLGAPLSRAEARRRVSELLAIRERIASRRARS